MDTISSTAFGVQMDSQKDPDHPMIINAKRVMGTYTEPSLISRIRAIIRIAMFGMYVLVRVTQAALGDILFKYQKIFVFCPKD